MTLCFYMFKMWGVRNLHGVKKGTKKQQKRLAQMHSMPDPDDPDMAYYNDEHHQGGVPREYLLYPDVLLPEEKLVNQKEQFVPKYLRLKKKVTALRKKVADGILTMEQIRGDELSESARKTTFSIGDKCRVYSKSTKKWCHGKIKSISEVAYVIQYKKSVTCAGFQHKGISFEESGAYLKSPPDQNGIFSSEEDSDPEVF